ncbi:MAG: GAF domain-containing protein [Anaerolineae bacterium]|nr:GAF domain-containing protein [Anaerolineae bacterium]
MADRTQALATSTEVSRRLSTILDLDELVNEVVNQTRDAFHYYHAQIYLFDSSKLYLLMAGGTGEAGQEMLTAGHKLRINQGVVGRAAATNQVVLIPDVAQDSNWLPNPLLPDTKSEAAIPIKLGDEVLGVLDVQHNVTNGLNEESVALLQSIANQVAVAIQNAQQVEQTNIQYELATELTQASQPEQILEAVSGYGRRLGASSAQLLFFENNEVGHPEWAVVRAAWHTEEGGIPAGTRYFFPDFGFAPLWLSSPEQPLLIADTSAHEAVSRELRKLYAQINILATAVLPLYAQGRWAGLVLFNWNIPHAFTGRDERIFTNLAQQTFSVVEAVQSAQRIQDALQEAEQLYQVSQRLSHATTLEASLVAALQTAIDANAINASLLTFELDQTGQPIWAEVTAAWSRNQMPCPAHSLLPARLPYV